MTVGQNKKVLWALAAAVLMAIPAVGDNIQLTGVGGNNQSGVFTVPYFVSINHGPSLTVMCDDYTHDVVITETWQGTVFHYGDLSADLGLTRAGASVAAGGLGLSLTDAQREYRELFWLFSQFEAHPAPSGNVTADHINFAAWAIFDPALIGNTNAGWTTGTNSAADWLAQAQDPNNWQNVNTSGFYIISPNDLVDGTNTSPHQNSSPQEYIGQTPVPEPAALALLGTGLIGLGSIIRRKLL